MPRTSERYGPTIQTAHLAADAVTTAKIADDAVTAAKIPANAILTADVDPDLIQTAEVTVSSAELLALRATPKTLVAAPGAGSVLEFHSAVLFLDYGTAQYTETADNLAVKYTDGSGAAASETIEATGFIDSAADDMTTAIAVKDVAAVANAALVLHNAGDGEYATGDSTMRVRVRYSVHATGF